jgi:hypothetical protein
MLLSVKLEAVLAVYVEATVTVLTNKTIHLAERLLVIIRNMYA